MGKGPNLPPCPPGGSVFGHFGEFSSDPLAFLTRCAAEYGDVASFRFPGARFCLVSGPEDIGRVFSSTNSSFISHGGMRLPLSKMLFGGGLLTSEGDEWRRQRRLTFPLFKHTHVPTYAKIMIDEATAVINSWKPGQVIDIFREMTSLTFRVCRRVLMDTSNALEPDEITGLFFGLRDGFLLKTRLQSLGMILPIPVRQRYRRSVEKINAIVSQIIQTRRSEPASHDDLLTVLMSATYEDGTRISDEQLRSEIKTFLFTSVFGAGLPIAWSFYSLAEQPEIANRLAEETSDIIDDQIDVRRCTLASCVLKEALRLYPPIWASGREAVADCEIGGFSIPKGTQIVISQWVMHRDPRFWTEPDAFIPSRWDETAARPRYAYFPHGGGPRFCMGDAFAELLAVIVLSIAAQRFSFRPISKEPVGLVPSYALFPDAPVELLVQGTKRANDAGSDVNRS